MIEENMSEAEIESAAVDEELKQQNEELAQKQSELKEENEGVLEDEEDQYAEAEETAAALSEEEKEARIQLLKPIVEGAVMAVGETIKLNRLQSLFDEHEIPSKGLLVEVLNQIQKDCEGRGFELIEVASGWRFQVRPDYASWVNRLWDEKPQKYSRALLETLALIAYRQPLTRGDIEEVRGVAVSSHIIKTLTEREWVKAVGHRDVPGRPALYATTRQFLDYFNLKSLDELPTLGELKDIESLNETLELDQKLSPEMIAEMKAEDGVLSNEASSEEASSESENKDVDESEKKSQTEEISQQDSEQGVDDINEDNNASEEGLQNLEEDQNVEHFERGTGNEGEGEGEGEEDTSVSAIQSDDGDSNEREEEDAITRAPNSLFSSPTGQNEDQSEELDQGDTTDNSETQNEESIRHDG